ncbi:hypothetical protein FJZ33_02485, partial [Candidatus Poribacteria bacterium]|nr:hypothetical protein [Candidatus Poribacteria bacterium]
WERQSSPVNTTIAGINFVSSELGWLMTRDATFLSTVNGGNTWRVVNNDSKPFINRYDSNMNPVKVSYNLKSVHFQSSSEGWAVGEEGAILHNVDGGPIWAPQDSKNNTTFNNIQFVSDKLGWAVGLWGVIAFTNDAGKNWYTQLSNTSYDLNGLHFVNGNEGWIVGRDGIILHTTNSGADWSSQYSGVGTNLNSVHFISNKEGWIAGDNGLILHTQNGGISWQIEGSGTDKHLYDICAVKDDYLLTAGAECTILKRWIRTPNP